MYVKKWASYHLPFPQIALVVTQLLIPPLWQFLILALFALVLVNHWTSCFCSTVSASSPSTTKLQSDVGKESNSNISRTTLMRTVNWGTPIQVQGHVPSVLLMLVARVVAM